MKFIQKSLYSWSPKIYFCTILGAKKQTKWHWKLRTKVVTERKKWQKKIQKFFSKTIFFSKSFFQIFFCQKNFCCFCCQNNKKLLFLLPKQQKTVVFVAKTTKQLLFCLKNNTYSEAAPAEGGLRRRLRRASRCALALQLCR